MSLKDTDRSPVEITPNVFIGATAVGIGGFVTKMDGNRQASDFNVCGISALPVNGGVSRNVVEKVRDKQYKAFVSYQTIETSAVGSFDPARKASQADVIVSASITKLTLVKRFEAAEVKAMLALKHPGGKHEPAIAWTGTRFTELYLDGYKITVTLDRELGALTNFQNLEERFKDPDFATRYADRFFRDPSSPNETKAGLPRFGKARYCMFSIVQKITCKHPDVRIQGHILSLEGFGAIHFGEVMVLPESRQLTLLRFKLGCKDEGAIVCCDVVSRGESCPP